MKPLLLLAALLLVAGCGGDPEPAAAGLTQEQACAEAERVTDTYQDALGDAASADDAKAVIEGAITGLQDIDTDAAVGTRIDSLAKALTDLRAAVEAGRPPAELQPTATAIGAATTALAQTCGRTGQ